MTRNEMIKRLRAAEVALIDVLDDLDPQSSECDSCGHTRYEDFNLKQAVDALQGAYTRVGKAAKYIKEPKQAPCAPTKEQQS